MCFVRLTTKLMF